jgi:hypothetical protein
MKSLTILACFLLSCGFLVAEDIEFNGFVDTYQAIAFKSPNDFNASRIRFRGEVFYQSSNASIFSSFNAMYNERIKSETGIELREAYMEYIAAQWDMRIGRQIITWGNADGLRITDIICPADYTEYITRDFDDIRIPVDAFNFRYLPGLADFQLIWLPLFEPSILPSGDNPWAVSTTSYQNAVIKDVKEPEQNLSNSEIAAKMSFYLSGIDLALSGFYTWDDTPTYHTSIINDTLYITPKYHRLKYLGLEINKPCGAFVIRSEAAYYKDKYFEDSVSSDGTTKKDLLKAMIGLDWYPGNDWNVSAQLADDLILDYETGLNEKENTPIITLNISKQILRQTVEISNLLYFGFNENDLYDRLEIDYAFTDELHFSGGTDIFQGNDSGDFGIYKDNSQLWFKAKYSF